MTRYFLFIDQQAINSTPTWGGIKAYQKEIGVDAILIAGAQLISVINDDEDEDEDECILVWPAMHTICDCIDLPNTDNKSQHISNTIKYHLEEYALEDIDAFTITCHPFDENQWKAVAIHKQLSSQWLAFLAKQHVPISKTILDTHLISSTNRTITIVSDESMVLINLDQTNTYACDYKNLTVFLESIIRERTDDHSIVHHHFGEPTIDSNMVHARYDYSSIAVPIEQWLVDHSAELEYWDVLPNKRKDIKHELYDLIKKPLFAISAAAVLLMVVVINTVSWLYYSSQEKEYQDQAVALYKEIYPQDKRIISLKRQLKQHINNTSSATNNNLQQLLVSALKPADVVDIQSLRFQPSNGLTIDIKATSHDAIQRYVKLIEENGAKAKLLNADQQKSTISAKIQVTL
ncbi:MAG: type II secretory pathway component PulL [Pseudomonadales bacterium]|jgi:type II secretory pathway component PulL